MQDVIQLFQAHGVAAVLLAVFLKQIGAPIPAVPVLLLAGAHGAGDRVYLTSAVAAATAASVLADTLWFQAGRHFGRSVLAFLCRVSLSPDTCVRKTELSFTKRGAWTVVLAKFIPGASMVARPLAGAIGMRGRTFFLLNLAGTLLWVVAAVGAGALLHAQVDRALHAMDGLGNAALLLVLAAFVLYLAWRAMHRYLVRRTLRGVPRVTPAAVARMLADGEAVLLLDVRAGSDSERARAAGAVAVPLGSDAFHGIRDDGPGTVLVAYCDCPGDVTAARAALLLAARGFRVHVLAGGIAAWQAAGLPLDEGAAGDAPAAETPPVTCPA
jgi:membrane protein DedA with SNARE-associated domain/rhodanese-related sulfurtransferase